MPGRQKVDVSIIIVNYNTCTLTTECIYSILNKTREVNFEIIVVDNASVDESVKTFRKKFPQINVIESQSNLGFGKANNLAALQARGEYLFFLNSDTLLINNAIGVLLNFMRQDVNKNIGICGGNLFTEDLKPNYSYSTLYPTLRNIFLYRSQLLTLFQTEVFNTSDHSKDVALIIGADLFIPKSIYEELEGFDPNFFMYVEDGELSYRARQAGYRIVSVPEAKIIHYQGKSSTTGNKLVMEVSSNIYFFKKHYRPYKVSIYKLIEILFATFKCSIFFILGRKEQKTAYLTLMKFLVAHK